MGSASVECFLTENDRQITVVFSGDVGNINQPIINDPRPVSGGDYVVLESTYGARLHDQTTEPIPFLVETLRRTFARGGSVIIPSFAGGRTQELLYFFREIKMQKLLPERPDFPVYLDSPLATQATAVFLQCGPECLDEQTLAIMQAGNNPIWFNGLRTTESADDSKALNEDREPKVIIASSGMCEAGRICHHLKHNIWNAANTILFVGYQAEGTLGRAIYDGAKEVKILGEKINVNAEIALLNGVSGHADQAGLLRWLDGMATKPARVFINHGDDENSAALSAKIAEQFGLPAEVPWSGSCFDLLTGEWISLAAPMPLEKAAPSEKKKGAKDNPDYRLLLEAAEAMLQYARGMEHHANHEIRKLTKRLNALMED